MKHIKSSKRARAAAVAAPKQASPAREFAASSATWLDHLAEGSAATALTFAGQGSPWLSELAACWASTPSVRDLVCAVQTHLQGTLDSDDFAFSGRTVQGLELVAWCSDPDSRPPAKYLSSSAISQPGIFLAQIARYVEAYETGLSRVISAGSVVGAAGHSQGVMAALLVTESATTDGGRIDSQRCAEYAEYMLWQGLWMARAWQQSPASSHDGAPMLAVSGIDRAELQRTIDDVASFGDSAAPLNISLENTRTRHVVSGSPLELARLRRHFEQRTAQLLSARKQGAIGGAIALAECEELVVESAFHSPHMHSGIDAMSRQTERLGFGVNPAELAWPVLCPGTGEDLRGFAGTPRAFVNRLIELQFAEPVRWRTVVRRLSELGCQVLIDHGPGVGVARLTAVGLRGSGIETLALAEPSGRRALFSESLRARSLPVRYSDFEPRLQRQEDGSVCVDNRYTRATGLPPVILPGMTPTTVDVPIVAAAANAGFTAELAGGGQVTEEVWKLRCDELAEALQPGSEVVFNALYLDRYLWDLHLGTRKLVQKARRAGAPICGVTVSAGIPETADAVRLLDELVADGMWLNAFKPGTNAQIDQVLAIADAAPRHTIFMHLEGGKAGGHHSWEDLEALLLARYHRIRERANIVLCVGGGIASEARSTALLTGVWARKYELFAMPVDAVFLGTLAMACAEATASAAVKHALAAAPGTSDWVVAGAAAGGITSGKSQLNADIHYIDNAAARCGRLLDAVAGDEVAVRDRRDAIIAACDATAKPYFGDVLEMPWFDVLERMVNLMAVGQSSRYEDGVWPDRSYRERVAALVWRAEARMSAGHESETNGSTASASCLQQLSELDDPHTFLQHFVAVWPSCTSTMLTASDAEYFVKEICARPGKPVNFVPVIDADVRRWYKSDSLWQAQNDRYTADQVLIIPGPEAVAGIVDNEPVAELLGRFEEDVVRDLESRGIPAPSQPYVRRESGVLPIPTGVSVERGEGVTIWRAGATDSPDCWFAALESRYGGLVARLFGQRRVFSAGKSQPNPLWRLCPSSSGATLWLESDGDELSALTWRPGDERRDAVLLQLDSPTNIGTEPRIVSLTIQVPDVSPQISATPWTERLLIDARGNFHREALAPTAVRDFYHRNLFGAPIPVAALFDTATAQVAVDLAQTDAYTALSCGGSLHSNGAPASFAFSLVFRPLMSALSCDELAAGLLHLVHLDNQVDVFGGWPLPPGANVQTQAQITSLKATVDGLRVQTRAEVRRAGLLCVEVQSTFLMRGFHCGIELAVRRRLQRELVLRPATPSGAAKKSLLMGLDWLQLNSKTTRRLERETGRIALQIDADIRSEAMSSGEKRHWATGTVRLDGMVVGKVRLKSFVSEEHPVVALADLFDHSTVVQTPLKRLAESTETGPRDIATWARASGDLNPIHRSGGIARLAHLPQPIVHGMWTAARTHQFAIAELAAGDQQRIRHFRTEFRATLFAAEPITFRAHRKAIDKGALHVELSAVAHRDVGGARVEELVLVAHAVVAPPRTAYVLPGQGIQRAGMGMSAYATSPAARAVWDQADAHTRRFLGFSLLEVVRDNPKQLVVNGELVQHKAGVLHLTQFTQVAMAVLASAQVAQMRAAGAFVDGAVTCGHSVGEYNALSAIAEVLPLTAVIEIVWLRGLTMHRCVPRDEHGASGYAMGVIRPHHAGMDEQQALELVANVAARTDGFAEVVNFNVRDRQYSVVGDDATLAAIEAEITARPSPTGKPAWVTVAGIDVPFHSSRLRDGVDAFRKTLQERLPHDDNYLSLVGRYIPNLVAIPFELTTAFVDAMVLATSAPEIVAIRAHFDEQIADPAAFARTLVIELLAFQFASPVRWIETQEVLLGKAALASNALEFGSLRAGVDEIVEIGVGYQPTVANMARQSAASLGITHVSIRNLEANLDEVLETDATASLTAESTSADAGPHSPMSSGADPEPVAVTARALPRQTAVQPQQLPADLVDKTFGHFDALTAILGLQARVRPGQIQPTETIDELFGGVSSRRNQVLVDIGAEFGVGAIDGAHEQPIERLAVELAKRAPGYQFPGTYLSRAADEAIRKYFGRTRASRRDLEALAESRYGLKTGLTKHFISYLTTDLRDGDSSRGGSLSDHLQSAPTSKDGLADSVDGIVRALGTHLGTTLSPMVAATGVGASVDAAVVDELKDRILGPRGVLMRGARDLAEQLGHHLDPSFSRHSSAEDDALADRESQTKRALQTVVAEHGAEWTEWIEPQFAAQQHVALTSAWAWAQRDIAHLFAEIRDGRTTVGEQLAQWARLATFAGDDRVGATARWYARAAAEHGDTRLHKVLLKVAHGGPFKRSSEMTRQWLKARTRPTATRPPDLSLRRSRQPLGGDPSSDALNWQKSLLGHVDAPLRFAAKTALVTGASPGSIAVQAVAQLLAGGARVVITTSRLSADRMRWYRTLYQEHAAAGAELHVVPFNAASNRDVDALLEWLFSAVTEPDGPRVRTLKAPFAPEIVLPFAALGDAATLDQLGPKSELAVRAMLLSVERLVAGIGAHYRDHGVPSSRCHVVVPMSPNHGGFGGDGAYAETKAGLEVLVNKWQSEFSAWGEAVTLCAAEIGWVRGTGLMGGNDPVAAELEERTGARTFSSAEMGWLIAALCGDDVRSLARECPLRADLTGGFAAIDDVRAVVSEIRSDLAAATASAQATEQLRTAFDAKLHPTTALQMRTIEALPQPPLDDWTDPALAAADWPKIRAKLRDTVVIVGAAELGPCGNSRTRWALEVEDKLSTAAVVELAWMCGLIRYESSAASGRWLDVESGVHVPQAELGDRYRDAVIERSGIRWTEPGPAGFDPEALPVLATAYLDRDLSFSVATEADARSFLAADPDHTRVSRDAEQDVWSVTRIAGAEIRVPRVARMSRRVMGLLPTGYDLTRMGIPGEMVESVDRNALFNLIATADAFLSAGMTPEELLAHVHPARVASTQGSGIGGMQALQRLYTDYLLDRERQSDTLQETLINVMAAYVVQSYVGSYGAMAHPVAACATAAISLEEGMDKILADRADFVIAGGYDDVGPEGALGFQDMGATCDTDQMLAMGLLPAQMSRANDVRRRGFVEAQGGGTLLLCRGDIAADLGLPVKGVLAWAGSFGDGLHKSIPAPGMGVVASAMGGKKSPLGKALRRFGLAADDIAVVYKHDTSTGANDPNESAVHHHIQTALGRTPGNPLFAVSQKTLTGHSKGGAAAWQTVGLCQTLATGKVAPNRNLESVDSQTRSYAHVAFTDRALQLGAKFLRAGLLTSLGFGHVGAIALIVHPAAFFSMLSAKKQRAWSAEVRRRQRASDLRRERIVTGAESLFERRDTKRFTGDAELAMLLDPDARLPADRVGGQL